MLVRFLKKIGLKFVPETVLKHVLHYKDNHSLTLSTRLGDLLGEASSLYTRLLGQTVLEALSHFPSNLNQKIRLTSLSSDHIGQHVMALVEPLSHHPAKQRGGLYRIVCKLKPSNESMELLFFYKKMSTQFLTFAFAEGKPKHIAGKLEKTGAIFHISHPLTGNKAISNGDKAEVVYPQITGLSSQRIHDLLDLLLNHVRAPLEWHDALYGYPSLLDAMRDIHYPTALQDVVDKNSKAYQRVLHDEILAQQVALLLTRQQTKKLKGIVITPQSSLSTSVKASLPFLLTKGQAEALAMIERDMASGEPMLRLLQGDVGCGKTVVAALSMANVIDKGYQGAILSPTDILATQHYLTFAKIFDNTPCRVALLTGKILGKKRQEILEKLARGEIHILIGTHALIQNHVQFQNLAMVVVDEQHRFGVEQRSKLVDKGPAVHLLSMTATPIPRTLQMTLCGDLDVTSILEKPKGRKDIMTSLHTIERVGDIVDQLKNIITPTNKAYWVCPLIEESESLDYTAVTERFAFLQGHFGTRVGLMHGRMRASEKDAVMKAFKDGDVDLLVSTTVIEVGVDVKTANIMIIEHAERFGLAQLHQLRGRVGRSDAQARCLLLYEKLSTHVRERLTAMKESNDGFYLAEMDLKIRGAGDMLGVTQSGQKPFHFYKGDQPHMLQRLLRLGHEDARAILEKDPTLQSERGQAVRELLHLFQKDNMLSLLRSG